MLRFYGALDGRLAVTSEEKEVRFISVAAPTEEEMTRLTAVSGVGRELFHAAMDPEAVPRVESAEGALLFTCASPIVCRQGDSMNFEVAPLSLVLKDKRATAICVRENPAVGELVQAASAAATNGRMALQFAQILAARFARQLGQIEKIMTFLEKGPGSARRNNKMQELLNLGMALARFSTALRENEAVLSVLLLGRHLMLTEEERLLLEHARGEMKRMGEQAADYSRLLDGAIGALASIASNNLSRMLRVFSVVILLLAAVLAVLFVYGLQAPGFPMVSVFLVLALSAFCMGCGAMVLHRARGTGRRAS